MPLATPVLLQPMVATATSSKVLLVDATKELRQHLSGLLRSAGYEFIAVDSLQAARQELGRFRPLMVLVDWRCLSLEGGPDSDYRLLRENAGGKDVPLLLVVGERTPAELLEQGIQGGVEDCMVGPLRGGELLARLNLLRELGERPPHRMAERRTPRTVLLVGEEAGAREGLGTLLEACGHHVLYAPTEERVRALPVMHGGSIHLLLVRTAVTSPEEMARVERLRADARLEQVPTVVVTSGADAEEEAFGQVWLSARTQEPRQLLARINSLFQRNFAALLVEERVTFVCPVEFREVGTWSWSSCFSSELSPGALFVRTLVPARSGAALEIRIHLPTTGEVLECTGLVAWSNSYVPRRVASYPLGMGVLFLGMSSRRLLQLRELCRSGAA